MNKRSLATLMLPGILCCLLLMFVSACSIPFVSTGGTNKPTNKPVSTTPQNSTPTPQPTAQTVAMPKTETSCPTKNTGRAAVMRPMAMSNHQNLVYVYNEMLQNTSTAYGHLRRYDTATGKKTDIVTSGIQILQAQISSNGQWALFLSKPDPHSGLGNIAELQLVRMDGKGLQTLMCLPYNGNQALGAPPIAFQWSVDEKSILISETALNPGTQKVISSIDILNASTGTVKPIFLDPADSQYLYTAEFWLDNTHAYIIKRNILHISSPTLPATVFLLDTTKATITNPGLKNALNVPDGIFTMDSSFDSTQLFVSACKPPSTEAIMVQPAAGGKSHNIYSDKNNCVLTLRAITTNTLLLVIAGAGYTNYQIWTMHTDGTDKQVLNIHPVAAAYNLNDSSQLPWSNVSRDGSSYALQQGEAVSGQSVILIGSLNGGDLTTIATTAGSSGTASLAGWTTM